MQTPHRPAWSDVVAIAKPFFVSPMRWRAATALGVIVGLLLALNALNVANSYVGRSFMTAISQRNARHYVVFAGFYLVVFAASTVTGVFAQFVQDRLALSWRDWLTRHLLIHYLSGHTIDRISAKREIDNPDQRISEDVRTFTSTLLSFMVMIGNAILTTVAFAGVLWSIAPALLLTAILYATLGSLCTVLLGRRLVQLDNLQLKKEADFRFGLIRTREHVQPPDRPAQGAEGRRILANLRRVVHNSRAIIGVNRNVGLFTSGYNYLVPLLPILIVAPRYLHGEIDFGVITQSAMAFAQLLGAFSLIIVQFQSISAFAAVVRRLGSLWQEMSGTLRGSESIPARDSIA